ncbi:uncharacterized protein LOC126900031 isoform X8 [Daktulosphaira vitifoliae]|uniref:uncharacterized protein LOC126900031 isoform X8 n=1 Tax=Daktulosphaira vitifoliae TaxID=58002 RepID=UPI0021AA5A9D|nr:uncharacterized protein LOC126900031 isoform X8 [Daktulosphaira vitifoliae]
MNLKFYFSVSILWSLKYSLTLNVSDTELKLYLVEVVNHIIYHDQFQEKFNIWQNIIVTDDSKKLNISLKKKITASNITPRVFSYILNSINCRYAKLLQIYDSYLTIMKSECENYYNKKLFNKFIECTNIIHNVVCSSKGIFKILHDNLIFINNLKINKIFSEYEAPYTIIKEIHNVYTYTSSKTKPCASTYIKPNGDFDTDDAIKDLLNIKNFYTTVIAYILHNRQLLDTTNNMNSNIIRKYLLEKYNEKYVLQQEIDKSFVQFIYDDLIIFFKENIKNEKDNLGFQELLHPIVPGLVPPFDDIIDCDKITTLNKLFAKCYLKPFMNIKIVVEKREIDAAEVFQIANSENIKEKIKYFGQLLRCRYVEILKNHHIILTAIMNACKDRTLSGIVNHFAYCMNQLRNSVSYSINMFKSLLFTMSKLKKLCFWEYNTKAPNCLKKLASIITEYVYDIKALNIVLSESKTMNEVEAQTYLDELYKYFLKLQKGFRNETSHHLKNRCEFLKEFTHPLTFKSSFNLKISTSIHDLSVYEDICLEMNSFCDEIIENDYKKLGFNDLI